MRPWPDPPFRSKGDQKLLKSCKKSLSTHPSVYKNIAPPEAIWPIVEYTGSGPGNAWIEPEKFATGLFAHLDARDRVAENDLTGCLREWNVSSYHG